MAGQSAKMATVTAAAAAAAAAGMVAALFVTGAVKSLLPQLRLAAPPASLAAVAGLVCGRGHIAR
jgi:hypothetical protein